jgi:hypothetical protein
LQFGCQTRENNLDTPHRSLRHPDVLLPFNPLNSPETLLALVEDCIDGLQPCVPQNVELTTSP